MSSNNNFNKLLINNNNTNNINIGTAKRSDRRMCYVCRNYGHLAKDCTVYTAKKDHWIKAKRPDGVTIAINRDDKRRRNKARRNKRKNFTRAFHFGKKIGSQPVDILMEDIKKAIWQYLQRFDLVQKVERLDEENKRLKEELFWYKLGEKRNHDLVSPIKVEERSEPEKNLKGSQDLCPIKPRQENVIVKPNPPHVQENVSHVAPEITQESQVEKIVETEDQVKENIKKFLEKFKMNEQIPQGLFSNDANQEVKNASQGCLQEPKQSAKIQVELNDSIIENEEEVEDIKNENKVEDQRTDVGNVGVEAFGASLDVTRMVTIREKCNQWVDAHRVKKPPNVLVDSKDKLLETIKEWDKETTELFNKALKEAVSEEDAEYYLVHEEEFLLREEEEMLNEIL